MARVTVEDCIEVIPNRYELVLVAAQRARDISAGSPITLTRDNDKNPVVALREIAEQTINLQEVRQHIVQGVNRMGDTNEEDLALLALANMGNELPQGATAVAIEATVFDDSATLEAAEGDDLLDEGDEDADPTAEGPNPDDMDSDDVMAVDEEFAADVDADLELGGMDDLGDEMGDKV